MIGLVLWFICPRGPTINYQYSQLSESVQNQIDSGSFNPNNFNLTNTTDLIDGKFEFGNWNYFDVSWSNLDINQYWLASGQIPGRDCDITKSILGYEYCGYFLGTFAKDSTFSTSPRTYSYLNVPLKNVNTANLASMFANCLLSGDQFLMSTGSVEADISSLRDFGTISVGNEWVILQC